MAITDKINIDFQVLSAGDPKLLIVLDTSTWGIIEDKQSIIEITPPNNAKTIVHYFEKRKSNVFNSSNLLLSPIEIYNDLADGVYNIVVKGSPDSNCKSRDFLKTDKIRLLIGDLYIEDYFSCKEVSNNRLKILRDIKLSLDSAEIKALKGKVKEASYELADVYRRVRDYIKCRD